MKLTTLTGSWGLGAFLHTFGRWGLAFQLHNVLPLGYLSLSLDVPCFLSAGVVAGASTQHSHDVVGVLWAGHAHDVRFLFFCGILHYSQVLAG